MTCKGVTDYLPLNFFNRDSIGALSKACAKSIPSFIFIQYLVDSIHAVKYHELIGNTPTAASMYCKYVLQKCLDWFKDCSRTVYLSEEID